MSTNPQPSPSGREERLDLIGAAEAQVGRYVYRRIEVLMDTAVPGSPEAAELDYLSTIAANVEEYGEEACGGFGLVSKDQAAALAARHPISSEDDNNRPAAEKGPFTPQEREALLEKLNDLAAAAETMSPEEARAVLAASEDDNAGGADTGRAGEDGEALYERGYSEGYEEGQRDAKREMEAALSAAPTPTQEGKEEERSQSQPCAEAGTHIPPSPQAQHSDGWRCKARYSSSPDPQDCDWPECGCDPTATRVLESITEAGCHIVREHLSLGELKRLASIWGCDSAEAATSWAAVIEALFYPEDASLSDRQGSNANTSEERQLRDDPSSPTQEGADDNAGAGDTGAAR